MTGGKAVVAIAEGKVVAEAEYFLSEDLELGRNLYLDIFWVHASYRRKGIGKTLFREIEELGREGGAERIVVLPDPEAKGFYERLGMKKIYEAFMIEMSSASKKGEIKERSFSYEEMRGMEFISPAIYSSLASWSKLFERDLGKAFYGVSEGCYFGLKLPPKAEAPSAFLWKGRDMGFLEGIFYLLSFAREKGFSSVKIWLREKDKEEVLREVSGKVIKKEEILGKRL